MPIENIRIVHKIESSVTKLINSKEIPQKEIKDLTTYIKKINNSPEKIQFLLKDTLYKRFRNPHNFNILFDKLLFKLSTQDSILTQGSKEYQKKCRELLLSKEFFTQLESDINSHASSKGRKY